MLNETEIQEIENKWHEFGYIDADKVLPLLSTVRELQRQVQERGARIVDLELAAEILGQKIASVTEDSW